MAAARTSVRGLSADEVQAIRDGVGAGRRPRGVFPESAGQISGQVGQVVSLLDPAESDEWMVVRFGRDELPFSPVDLQVAPKGAAARKAVVPAPAAEPGGPPRPEPEVRNQKADSGQGSPGSPGRRRGGGSGAGPAEGAGSSGEAEGPGRAD